MDNSQIAKQMIQFNKTAFENGFNAMNMIYEQNEKMTETVLAQSPWFPEAGKQAIVDWMTAYRAGCNDLKKMVDDNYAKFEDYFAKQ